MNKCIYDIQEFFGGLYLFPGVAMLFRFGKWGQLPRKE